MAKISCQVCHTDSFNIHKFGNNIHVTCSKCGQTVITQMYDFGEKTEVVK